MGVPTTIYATTGISHTKTKVYITHLTNHQHQPHQRKGVPITIYNHLINNSFPSSSFPFQWKKAEIVPILKSGNSEEPADTRPISLLPILSKMCERAAHSQLVNFLDSSNIIHQMQSGNRKFHSTESSLLYFTDELLHNMDHGKMSVIVLLD